MSDGRPIGDADSVVLREITKRFGVIVANDRVDIELRRGEVHALLGENGAGKTTLMNILSGLYQPNEGEILAWGQRVTFRTPKDALRQGIGMVHQDFQLIDAFTVTDNVLLSHPGNPLRLRRAATARALEELGRQNGLPVKPDQFVWQLSVGERQRVEILKLLFRSADLLILDEPTAVLTPQESDDLYRALRRLADAGRAIVFITHKLREVMASADRITVLRRGRVVASTERSATALEDLADLMIGSERRGKLPSVHSKELTAGADVLRLDDVSAEGEREQKTLKNVSLSLHSGEILGLVGVAGNGQAELAELIAGLRRCESGSIAVDGKDITNARPLEVMRAGVRYIPEDRTGVGLVPELNLAENVILRDYREAPFGDGIRIHRVEARKQLFALIEALNIRTPGFDSSVGKLSGGNQQKLLLGRELHGHPRVLIAAQPTRGLDIEAAATIQARLIELRNLGVGVLLISEDLDEVLEISDRISVMYAGEVTEPQETRTLDRASIGLLMGGARAEEATHE